MRFIGTHLQTLDAKARLVLPARFKRQLAPDEQDSIVLLAGRESCLLLVPLGEWSRLAQALDALPRGEAKRDAIRAISDHSTELELDAHGRLTLPRDFLDEVGIEREVAVVGALRYIEVWPRAHYDKGRDKRRQESRETLDAIL